MSIAKQMAYPSPAVPAEKGLTKLEYFAGLAMQGIISNAATRGSDAEQMAVLIATTSVQMAKAMIAELEKAQ